MLLGCPIPTDECSRGVEGSVIPRINRFLALRCIRARNGSACIVGIKFNEEILQMKDFLKKLIPEPLLNWIRPYYHGILAWDANIYYERPSEKLMVIGVTGTAGKSTTIQLLAHILNSCGKKTGYITTVDFFDGQNIFINKHGLSMPGEVKLQKQLRTMVQRRCKYAIVECTSEGLAQNRHWGINFDVAVFTNLSRAHLQAHGSYGNYQAAKGKLFKTLMGGRRKSFFPQKMIGMNFDDPQSGYFFSFPADRKFGVTFTNIKVAPAQKVFYGRLIKPGPPTEFSLDGVNFSFNMLGAFNAQNAALAVSCACSLGVSLADSAAALKSFSGVRGRMESVPNSQGFKIIVDYGCEPASFLAALEATVLLPHNRLIHVFGSTGGHRDVAKRFEFGQTSAKFTDQIIITNDDIYDSDPAEIGRNIESGIRNYELRKPPYEIILDRRQAIYRALSIAQPNDIVLITGKGSEQFLVLPGNKRIEWDDCGVVREELSKIGHNLNN